MARVKAVFSCVDCATEFPQWQGQCTGCNAWNTIAETKPVQSFSTQSLSYAGSQSQLTPMTEVATQSVERLPTGLSEFDFVLGGGLVSDSVVLIGGDPGIGKSTLILQILSSLSVHHKVMYVTGEESLQQIALRARRLHVSDQSIQLLAETKVEHMLSTAQQYAPNILVVDSIQTVHTQEISSAPGGVAQVRESAAQLVRYAKTTGTALLLIGHVTKEGALAGPRVLEHMVDTVLYFEGRSDNRFRMIRAVKNRFGAVNEMAVFAMTDRGLRQVDKPSSIFLNKDTPPSPGRIVMVAWEGSRPLLVEVQALLDDTHVVHPRRVAVGVETNRLSMLLATLHRHGGVQTSDQDIFVNVVGGVKVLETAADLAVLIAIVSSLKNITIPSNLLAFGEVGLCGELRPVQSGQERIKEGAKHGFEIMIVPRANAPKKTPAGVRIIAVDRIDQALRAVFE